ncbi:MAG TPA: DUF4159 domain-containing protein, partial [Isosphaeraceae bacterium]|nr:DUF4159 domain-containing protein [Isosphaeraceae bacterium]
GRRMRGMGPMMGQEDPRRGVPNWERDPRFKRDVFTFVRVEYNSGGGGYFRGGRRGGYWRGGGWGWATDYPDSDLNFSFRLQQLTSLKVNPDPISLRLTDEQIFDYPFLYMIEPGGLFLSDEEATALRKYLFNGGFLMVDDFWGDYQWENFYHEIKKVFPDREPEELPIDHEIFRCVYRLKEKPQVPSIHAWEGPGSNVTWEPYHGGDCQTVHYRAFFDDNGRMVAIICHNTDLGDGWEREGENEDYFHEFSEKKSYPMGINIVTYAMTH